MPMVWPPLARKTRFSDAGVNSCRGIILAQMVSVLRVAPPDAIRRIQRVQTVTIAWMSVEAAVSLFAVEFLMHVLIFMVDFGFDSFLPYLPFLGRSRPGHRVG